MKTITSFCTLLTQLFLLIACASSGTPSSLPEAVEPTSEKIDLVNFTGKAKALECGKNLVRRLIDLPQSNWGRTDPGRNPSTFVTYPDVCAWLGAFWFIEAAIDNALMSGDNAQKGELLSLMQELSDKYHSTVTGEMTYTDSKGNKKPVVTYHLYRGEDNRVDYYIFGAIPLHIASIMDNPKYEGVNWHQSREEFLSFGLEYAEAQWELLSLEEFNMRFNSAKYNKSGKLFTINGDVYNKWKSYAAKGYSWQTRMWIDDMFMITALQLQAYQATKGDPYYNSDPWYPKKNEENRFLDRAVREMELYIDEIQGEDGLYWHSPSARFFWARGNGWMAVGMPEMLKIIDRMPSYKNQALKLRREYASMMASLLKYQKADGMWAQLIDKPDLWSETSGTAMFTYAFLTGVERGWLDYNTFGGAARKAWTALINYLEPTYDIREVCEGTGIGPSVQYYSDRKRYTGDTHGQAGMLWIATALMNIANSR